MTAHQPLYDSRYGGMAQAVPDISTPVIDQLMTHRSVRAFRPDAVSDAQLSAMIAAAQSAASSSNLQVWSVVAVRDQAVRDQLAEFAGNQAHIRQAPLQLVWLADLSRLERVATAEGRPSEALDYTEMFLTAVIDAALAAQNAVAAAESMGLSTVYIGGMRNRPEDVARVLKLPPKTFAVFGMCVGHEDDARPASVKPRLPQSAVLHHESYSTEQDDAVAAYNTAMARFYEAQKMDVKGNWSVHSAKRVAGPASLSGRDRLVDALKALGFSLK
ncbi:MAG: NADPH-dependent oxidoreductase [Denitromonas halophila]|nr:MAG: NADPH-dependent oxidoreductase [Denitromonas halophila]